MAWIENERNKLPRCPHRVMITVGRLLATIVTYISSRKWLRCKQNTYEWKWYENWKKKIDIRVLLIITVHCYKFVWFLNLNRIRLGTNTQLRSKCNRRVESAWARVRVRVRMCEREQLNKRNRSFIELNFSLQRFHHATHRVTNYISALEYRHIYCLKNV